MGQSAGKITGGLIGGAIGFITGGPAAAVAGAAKGAAMGLFAGNSYDQQHAGKKAMKAYHKNAENMYNNNHHELIVSKQE